VSCTGESDVEIVIMSRIDIIVGEVEQAGESDKIRKKWGAEHTK
jgi:hypothetical protein